MKQYQTPELVICTFDVQDIITASGDREDEIIVTNNFELPVTTIE